MNNLMRVVKFSSLVVFAIGIVANAMDDTGRVFLIGASPFLSKEQNAKFASVLVKLVLEDAKAGETIELVNGWTLDPIFSATIPEGSRNVRANRLAQKLASFQKLRLSIQDANQRARLNILGLFDLASKRCLATHKSVTLVLCGSPLHSDDREPSFNFAEGYVPNDAHLSADQKFTPFGTAGRAEVLRNVSVYFCLSSASEFESENHREALCRFWSLYSACQGASALKSFDFDVAQVFAYAAHNQQATQTHYTLDTSEKSLQMISPAIRTTAIERAGAAFDLEYAQDRLIFQRLQQGQQALEIIYAKPIQNLQRK